MTNKCTYLKFKFQYDNTLRDTYKEISEKSILI